MLGAGGAARAIVAALLAEGCPEVRIANRTRARADVLRDHFGPRLVPVDWARRPEAAGDAATVVNTTSVGMEGAAAVPLDLGAVAASALVTDIVYGAEPTPFIRAARARGLAAVDGLGMLLHQGVPGFERWFGRRPEVDAALRAAVLAP